MKSDMVINYRFSHVDEFMKLYDAHNHLQDERLMPHVDAIMRVAAETGVTKMVVNGACEEDWPAVLDLAQRFPQVLPSFGYHPWYVQERTPNWQAKLIEFLDTIPSAVGEIGLDRWKEGLDLPSQEEVFIWQLRLASERNLPVSIHCLQAWGRLFDILRTEPRPAVGFVLHSYGGPQELIQPLAKLGAYFSMPGYFAHERKVKQRETFRHVPIERLLIETDAPDQSLPPERVRFPLAEANTGKPINHPANLIAVYQFTAELLEMPLEKLAARVEANFLRLFTLENRNA